MWQRLFIRLDDEASSGEPSSALADALIAAAKAAGYTPYDPFGLMPGLSYPLAIKAFAAPHDLGGWRAVIASADPIPGAVIASAAESLRAAALHLTFDTEGRAEIAWFDGDPPPELARIIDGDPLTIERYAVPAPDSASEAPVLALPIDALPEDVRSALVKGQIDETQAEKLFAKMSGAVAGKLGGGGGDAEAAKKLLQSAQIDWESSGGRRIRAALGLFGLGAALSLPDFTVLRDAYALHARKRRKPDAPLYPGDAEAMAAVADALAYTPIFAGRRA
jgi:hypothetical protein